ncbi:MAG: hypothetical protein OEY28_06555 [Nitrospira sp.]|nr:hypothetical protein [Nitrospira sp.]
MMTTTHEYKDRLSQLAELMLAVAGESVAMMKKTAPDRVLTLKRQNEWGLYLEFLKIQFNLADRLVALHIPIKDHMDFMNGLEDAVAHQLRKALEPAFGSNTDQMEIALTIGTAVAESRRLYEPYTFLVTEESKTKGEMFREFGDKIAEVLGAPGDSRISSAATLCADAVIPAIDAVLQGQTPPDTATATSTGASAGEAIERKTATGQDIKLISMMSSVSGETVETRWGLHPRFREDLTPDELQQLTKLLNRVAKIAGERYAAVAFSEDWASWHKAGNA